MATGVATLVLAAAFLQPNPYDNFYNFLDVIAAKRYCASLSFNQDGVYRQVNRAREQLGLSDAFFYDAKAIRERMAELAYNQKGQGFCRDAVGKLGAYDPAYLRRVGVID